MRVVNCAGRVIYGYNRRGVRVLQLSVPERSVEHTPTANSGIRVGTGEQMRTKYIAVCVAVGTLTIGSPPAVRAQKPADEKGAQYQQMMQGMTDALFVPMMIKHHQHGIEMARLEEDRGASVSVKALAVKVRQSQEKELTELKAHSEHAIGAKGTPGRADHNNMMEQQSQMMMKRLKSASGAALDRAFLEDMAKHHQMAISMTEGAKLQDPELKKLAQRMVAGQRQELAELKKELSAHSRE
jgi:uncharacterized protein (DUF305 family)